MRKDRLYLFTFISIAVIFFILSLVAVELFIKESTGRIFSIQMESGKREAKEVAALLGNQLSKGVAKENVIKTFQASIQNSNSEAGFISVFDWSGKVVCHPDKTRVGQKLIATESSTAVMEEEMNSDEFYELLQNRTNDQHSKIIYMYPVDASDWIIAMHANMDNVDRQMQSLRQRFYLIFSLMGVLLVVSSFFAIRFLGSKYEKKLEIKNEVLENELVSLSKLNGALVEYQQKTVASQPPAKKGSPNDGGKKRLLTYVRNELLPTPIDTIAYVYMENTITYVVCFDGRRSTSNQSLDELYSNLDENNFYRANRQFIIAISAIEKIIRYGNNQLKILVNPNSEVDIIISKNRAAEFKQWLNL